MIFSAWNTNSSLLYNKYSSLLHLVPSWHQQFSLGFGKSSIVYFRPVHWVLQDSKNTIIVLNRERTFHVPNFIHTIWGSVSVSKTTLYCEQVVRPLNNPNLEDQFSYLCFMTQRTRRLSSLTGCFVLFRDSQPEGGVGFVGTDAVAKSMFVT